MRELGLTATELGSNGYLPTDPAQLKDLCSEFGITMIGGFVPLVVHRADELDATIEAAHRAAALMSSAGGTHVRHRAAGRLGLGSSNRTLTR